MSSPDRRPQEQQVRLTEDAARLLLVRASELDATNARMLSVAQVREAAQEAGISPYAFDAALAELQQPAVAPVPKDGFIPWRHRRKMRGAMFAVAAACLVVGGIFASRARLAPAPESVTSEVVVTSPDVQVQVRLDTVVMPRMESLTETEAQEIHARAVEQAAIDAARRAEETRQAAEAVRRQTPR